MTNLIVRKLEDVTKTAVAEARKAGMDEEDIKKVLESAIVTTRPD